MAKVKLNEKQLKVGQRELDGAYNASQQKKERTTNDRKRKRKI